MRTTISIALLFAGCCFVPQPAAAPPAPGLAPACLGTWRGAAVQVGANPWSIEMTVTEPVADACGTIEYPSLGCGGVLMSCGTLPSGEATFTEVYTHGQGNCAAAGVIRATCSAAGMAWTWEGQGGPVSSTLSR